jgi:hypothetical protein
MPGSPEVVQTLPPSPPVFGAASAKRVRQRESARRAANAISKVAWSPHEDLGQAEWLATGRRLGAIGRCSQWWIGDWVRYGTARWGEKYAEAARVTGYDVASLRNMAWVASRFDSSLRSDKLTWSHHVLLAPLEPVEQARWLDRAQRERLSVADLRLELRSARGKGKSGEPTQSESGVGGAADPLVCPHCGHRLKDPDE